MEEHFLGKVAVKAIIPKDGKILIVRDRRDVDIWELPGGRVNVGEGIEIGLKREVMEELGVNINFKRLVHSEQHIHIKDGPMHLFIVCEVAMVDPVQAFKVPSEELAEMKWVDKNAISEFKIYDDCKSAINIYWDEK
jgi:ADP-ribose pyrophosphatase YjhB (NUDIX family)